MTHFRKTTPKPVRAWTLARRNKGKPPYLCWWMTVRTRAEIEDAYMLWMYEVESFQDQELRDEFRAELKAKKYTVERVTITAEHAA